MSKTGADSPPPPPSNKHSAHHKSGKNRAGHRTNFQKWVTERSAHDSRFNMLSSTGVTRDKRRQDRLGSPESGAGSHAMDGGLSLNPAPDGVERPFKIAFYNAMDLSQSEDVVKYVMGELMPAAASLYRRHMRVRYPSGKMNFHGRKDLQDQPIPNGPNGEGVHTFT